MSEPGDVELEVRSELDQALDLRAGGPGKPVVRIAYRPVGSRRWTRFVVQPSSEQTVEEILRRVVTIAQLHLEQSRRST